MDGTQNDTLFREMTTEEAQEVQGGYGIFIRPKGRVYSPG